MTVLDEMCQDDRLTLLSRHFKAPSKAFSSFSNVLCPSFSITICISAGAISVYRAFLGICSPFAYFLSLSALESYIYVQTISRTVDVLMHIYVSSPVSCNKGIGCRSGGAFLTEELLESGMFKLQCMPVSVIRLRETECTVVRR